LTQVTDQCHSVNTACHVVSFLLHAQFEQKIKEKSRENYKDPSKSKNYFLVAQNSASNQPIPVQPSTQLAMRIIIISYFPLPFMRASQAGAKIIPTITAMQIAYLTIMM
jgi:hypothetical protein